MSSAPRIIELVGPPAKEWGGFQIAGSWVGTKFGLALSLYNLHTSAPQSAPTPALTIPDARTYVLTETCCFVAHPDHTISRWDADQEGQWKQYSTFALPEEWRDKQPLCRLALSPSGAYLHAQLTGRTLLYRVADQQLIYEAENTGATAQFAFLTMPSGRELAYLTTKSYLEVTLIDCASGQELYHKGPDSLFDVIHTSMRISHDGQWLFASGLVWADKPEALVYDIEGWEALLQGLPAQVRTPKAPTEGRVELPWRRCFRFYPPLCGEDALLPGKDAIQDGTLQVHSYLEDIKYLAEEIEEDDEYLEDLPPTERALAQEVYALRHTYQDADITRWFDLKTEQVLRFKVTGSRPHKGQEPRKEAALPHALPASYTPPEGARMHAYRCLDGAVWVVRVVREEGSEGGPM